MDRSDLTVRSDSVNVEQIMEQIRARIREKRGVDYTEQQIRELAAVKLEKFLDPKGVRSDLLEAYRRAQSASTPPAPPNFAFGEETLFETHRGPLRFIRRLLSPILKLFFNPNPLIQALHIQADLNTLNAQRETARRGLDQLHFEVLHNLVIETTRMSIELKNLKMRVESIAGRLEFNERRARALESVVAYRPAAEERPRAIESSAVQSEAGVQPPAPSGLPEGPGQRSRRRRRRRGRRGGGSAAAIMGGASGQPRSESMENQEGERHGGTAETIEQAMGSESGPTEPPDPPTSVEPSGDQ